ncbi:MAG TPA: hypothetical protein VGE77_09865 [Nocardioides sp.]
MSSVGRGWVPGHVVGVLAVLAVLALPAGAVADGAGDGDPPPVEVRADGGDWGAALGRPLFDPALRWVPGDSRTAVLHVRHHEPEEGALTVTVRPLAAPSRGATWDDLALALRIGDGRWRTTRSWADEKVPAPVRVSVPAAAGDEIVVAVRVAFAPGAQGDMRRAADLDVEVALAGDEPSEGPTSRPVGESALLAPGLLACAAGTALLLARRPEGTS